LELVKVKKSAFYSSHITVGGPVATSFHRLGIAKTHIGQDKVQSTLFCIFNHCYFISSPNKLKICHTI